MRLIHRSKSFAPSLTTVTITVLVSLLPVFVLSIGIVPQSLILLGLLSIPFLLLWAILWFTGHDFTLLFLLLFAIGYIQGITGKVVGDSLPDALWGLSKYGLIVLMMLSYFLHTLNGQKLRFNNTIITWAFAWLLFCAFLGILIIEALTKEPSFSPILPIQQFAVGNMLLLMLVYLQARREQMQASLWLFSWAGILAALFGIAQRLLGPTRLQALGLDIRGGNYFLPANNPETNWLDTTGGLRAFSFFDTHHAFGAFLILAIIALHILWLQRRISRPRYTVLMLIMGAGMAVTFNLTNILTVVLALGITNALVYEERLRSFLRILANGRLWRTLGLSSAGLALLVISVPALRNRLIGAFDVRQGSAGAGGSLAYRLEGLTSGIQAIIDYPLGFGLYLESLRGSGFAERYVRIEGYFTRRGVFFSGDNWFQWLMVQVGLPAFLLYLALFLIPLVWAWRYRHTIQDHGLRHFMYGIIGLMVAVILAGVSNSPVLAFPPSNLLIWAAVGALCCVPRWDREIQKQRMETLV